MKRVKHTLGLAIVVLLGAIGLGLSSCTPFALVNVETYNGANLADYHTFRIVTPSDSVKLPPTMTEVTYYNIAAAVREMVYPGTV